MNKRIQKLTEHARVLSGEFHELWKAGPSNEEFFQEKFTQLIVQECCDILNEMHSWQTMNNQEYSSVWHDAIDQGIDQIKEHLGAKE